MSDTLLRIYHRMPTAAQMAAAGAMGLYLRKWRFGKQTERLVADALARDKWTPERWHAYQQERLAHILERAATRVPYYRDYWSRRRSLGDRTSWDQLEHWPVLEKDIVRRMPEAFVADDMDTRRMYCEQTSGTTGTPLRLWWSRETVREWYALNEARSRRWYGISRQDRWAIVGGRVVAPVTQRQPPFWIWNFALKQLYMSAYHLSPELAPTYLDALVRHRITYLFGYSSGLHALAEAALRLGRTDLRLAVAISNAEPLLDHQRRAIERAFRCPVRETYGLAEIVGGGSECDRGRLHLWPEVGIVEVLAGTQPVAPGGIGDLVSTGLINPDMPLIRYRTGDAIRLSPASCACGRQMPVVQALEGRCDDLVITADGRRVGRLDTVFKDSNLGLREAQIVQETHTRFTLRYVTAAPATADLEDRLRRRMQEHLGAVDVTFERVDHILRSAQGKFRAVVSKVARDERQEAAS
ncbi:MAG: phenylacetate--CoA ligase family protein [Acidobacteria bacterium]|nr:phenylacetate--CoA ligase family protein [Acidobacteriota bacterium]